MPKPILLTVAVLGLGLASCGRGPSTKSVVGPTTTVAPSPAIAVSTTTTSPTTLAPKATLLPSTTVRASSPPSSTSIPVPTTATSTTTTSTTVAVVVTGSLRDHLIDSTIVPSGFLGGDINDGLVNAPAKRESVGRRWSRPHPGATEDDISVYVTRFPTPAAATNFNTGFAQEYATNGALIRTEAIAGIPGSKAYLNQPDQATAWFTVDDVAAMVYVVDASESSLTLAETLARAEYQALLRA